MYYKVPIITNRIVCICDRNRPELAAVISSYLATPDEYIPLFEFPWVAGECRKPGEISFENLLSFHRANEVSTFINNIVLKIRGCELLILAGLTTEQKTYLFFLNNYNVVEIDSISEIDFYLFAYFPEREKIICREDQILEGLRLALISNKLLEIRNDAEPIELKENGNAGLIVLERESTVSGIVGVNYSYSINAELRIVPALIEDDELIIANELSEWRKGSTDAYSEIEKRVLERVGHIEFGEYEFVTFFTWGLPYSIILKNPIPATYISLKLNPAIFIINSLIYEAIRKFGGAIVFSPEFFRNEECKVVSNTLSKNGFYVRQLYNKEATVRNLDFHLKEFPYDALHICSHGGEVKGTTITEDFTDRDGVRHTVEYDSVLTISPSIERELFEVQHKWFYKTFDGLKWKSKELKDKYPPYVFADMFKELQRSKAANKKTVAKNVTVSNSCAIKASDGLHQGMFQTIASHSSPVVFNNTCWSWGIIAENFLAGGARAYIGTVWDVTNAAAVNFAEEFYKYALSEPIMISVYNALKSISGTASADVYILWGLHFSSVAAPESYDSSRARIFRQLLGSFYLWQDNLEKTADEEITRSIKHLQQWIMNEIRANFFSEFVDFMRRAKEFKSKHS